MYVFVDSVSPSFDQNLNPETYIKIVMLVKHILGVGKDTIENMLTPKSNPRETSFGINYLSNFVLALLLLESMDKYLGRIVVLSSWTRGKQFSEPIPKLSRDWSYQTASKSSSLLKTHALPYKKDVDSEIH